MNKVLWFFGGAAVALMMISAVHAAIPSRSTPGVTELQANKANTPDFEQDYQHLTSVENRYAESWDQQERLRKATQRVAGGSYSKARPVATAPASPSKKKSKAQR